MRFNIDRHSHHEQFCYFPMRQAHQAVLGPDPSPPLTERSIRRRTAAARQLAAFRTQWSRKQSLSHLPLLAHHFPPPSSRLHPSHPNHHPALPHPAPRARESTRRRPSTGGGAGGRPPTLRVRRRQGEMAQRFRLAHLLHLLRKWLPKGRRSCARQGNALMH